MDRAPTEVTKRKTPLKKIQGEYHMVKHHRGGIRGKYLRVKYLRAKHLIGKYT